MADYALIDSDNDLDSIIDGTISDQDSLYEECTPPEQDGVHQAGQEDDSNRSTVAIQATKAIEAAQDSDDFPYTPMSDEPLLHRALSSQYGWNDPILDAGPAPPDYAAATSSRGLEAFATASESHHRESTDGARSSPTVDQISNPALQSLPTGLFRQLLGSQWQWIRRFGYLPIFLFSIFLALRLTPRRIRNNEIHFDHLELYHRDSEAKMHSSCKFDSSTGWIDIPFENPSSFSLIDMIGPAKNVEWKDGPGFECEGPNFTACTLGGKVKVYHTGNHDNIFVPLGIPLLVRISVATATPFTLEKVNYEKTGDSLTLKTPVTKFQEGYKWEPEILSRGNTSSGTSYETYLPWSRDPCLDYQIRIYIRKSLQLTNWISKLRHFDFHVSSMAHGVDASGPGFFSIPPPRISNSSFIQNQHGLSSIHVWNSRKTHIESRTGNISAIVLLGDELTVETWSGNVVVNVESWDLNSNNSDSKHTQRTIRTVTRSGKTTIENWPRKIPYNRTTSEEHPWHVHSEHLTTSGAINLKYPRMWTGTLEGMSVYGNITLKGIEKERSLGSKDQSAQVSEDVGHAQAYSKNAGHVKFGTETGHVEVFVGERENWVSEHR